MLASVPPGAGQYRFVRVIPVLIFPGAPELCWFCVARQTAGHRPLPGAPILNPPALHSFAHGIRRDQQAVTAGLALPCSSGALEGKNGKIKYLKRLMDGRANFDLLRKMALLN